MNEKHYFWQTIHQDIYYKAVHISLTIVNELLDVINYLFTDLIDYNHHTETQLCALFICLLALTPSRTISFTARFNQLSTTPQCLRKCMVTKMGANNYNEYFLAKPNHLKVAELELQLDIVPKYGLFDILHVLCAEQVWSV